MPIKKSTFERPPSAPIFKPTIKEFEDPLTYIEKIRPVAQKYGICKIISPKQWNPPFSVDRNSFKFRPRVQRLNEVGAQARIKSVFNRSIEAYWEFQNAPLVSPVFRGIHIDLFELHNKVRQHGGSHQVSKNKQWTKVCRELGMADKAKTVSWHVKGAYEKLVQPYLDFCDNEYMENNKEMFPEDIAPARMRGKTAMTLASPKMTRSKTQKIKKQILKSCKICSSVKQEDDMVTCTECDTRFHINCLTPPLSVVISPWNCSRCLQINCARELSRLDAEVFGFAQSACKYSLESFASYADSFKKTYFKDRENVSLKDVEEEYWRLVAAEDDNEDVTVKYGADISSGLTSSGFPTKGNRHLLSESDQKYVDNGWNLNNLPVLEKSIFRFVSNDISGMTVPWCYVGMVFSCFCWHIEDHWSYSINYMHTGECKTWYGVPESDAELFENLMRKEAGQLFEKSPDLLHHITTQINPTVLMKNKVKVFRADQAPGEFVVTFPRAYHAGFNQGYNFAEAVNFCPADWLSKGRASVESYRLVKRPSVFSHNELICKMASSIDSLDIVLLKAVYDEMVIIQQEEKASRKLICTMAHGSCRTERLQLDQMVEDDRECVYCRSTLYMSGVTCSLCFTNERMTCLDHVKQVCRCTSMDNVVLKYRFSLDEISAMVATVKNKLEQYNLWMTRLYHLAKSEFCSSPVSAEEGRVMRNVSKFVENLGVLQEDDFSIKCVEEKPNLEELRMLLQLGRKMNCPELLLDFLEAIIDTCQRAMNMTDKLLKSHRTSGHSDDNKENNEQAAVTVTVTKTVTGYEDQSDKLRLGEMRMLVEKLRSLPAHVPQLEEAAQTLYSINEWRKNVKRVVSTGEVVDSGLLSALIESGESNLVYLSEYQMLQKMRVHAVWIAQAGPFVDRTDRSSLPTLAELKKLREDGTGLLNVVEIDRIATLSETLELDDEDELSCGNDDEMSDYRRTGWNTVIEHLKRLEKELLKVISEGEAMQKEAEDILRSTPGVFALSALKMLLKRGESRLNCVVNGIEQLKEVLKEAVPIDVSIGEMWQKLQQNRRLVHIDDLQALIKQADSLCVSFDYLHDLKSINDNVEAWRKNLYSLFVKNVHNSNLNAPSLLEILFPRPTRMFKLMIARETISSKLVAACKAESTVKKDEQTKEEPESCDDDKQWEDHKPPKSANRGPRKSRGRQKRSSCSSDDPQVARLDNVAVFDSFLKSSSSSSDVDSFCGMYKNMCINELEWMWNLRDLNEDKANKDSSGHDFYCFCRKRGMDQKGAQVMCDLCQDWFHLACLGIQNKDLSKKKFLCPQCERSKRPAFEVILAEKRELEHEAKMLKIPEHIVLCLLSQRVISFHKHTNQLFSSQTELGAVFAEYKKLFGVQAILPKYQPARDSSSPPPPSSSSSHDHQVIDSPFMHLSSGKQSRKTPHSMLKSGVAPVNAPPPAVQLSPVPSKETLMNIRKLKISLTEDARRELEEIYIELCLLEVNQPTVTWIWKLYHSLIDEVDEVDNNKPPSDKYPSKKEQVKSERLSVSSDNSDTEHDKADSRALEAQMLKLSGKYDKRSKRSPNIDIQMEKSIKRECLSSFDDRNESHQKFSFKRKLAAKSLVPPPAQVKKQPTVKQARGVATRKRGRGGKNQAVGYREDWDRNTPIASEYYDEENDEILLDNVEITRRSSTYKSKRVKTTSGSIKSASDTKSTYEDPPGTSARPLTSSGRQQRQASTASYLKQLSAERSDYSDENSPSQVSYDTKPAVSLQKRGRKPSLSRDLTSNSSSVTQKRRRRGAAARGSAGSKRVCNDDCEADECVQQSSDKVNWIACDDCNLWYHCLCVGIKSDMEVVDRFLCPRCKDNSKLGRLTTFRDNNFVDIKQILSRIPSLADEVTEDMEADDLNVTLDDEVVLEVGPLSSLNRIPSLTGSVDMVMQTVLADDRGASQDAYFRGMSPPPPFLQPECGVQEEVVEISYVSRSDSD